MDIKEIAREFGIKLTDERAAELTMDAETFQERLNVFEAADPDHDPVEGVDDGDDSYNAFRYRFRAGGGDGALSGYNVAIKDNIAVAGVPMHCGSREIEYIPPYHATATANLLAEGATLLGTTNMDKLAYFTTGETCDFGPTKNPEVTDRVAGGSSSGSGAAVAGGLVDAALGSDTGGSVRIPAAFCGIVGFKPTYRSVSRFGMVDLAPSLDHVGTLARSVETAARVLESLTGPDVHDPSTYATTPPQGILEALKEPVSGLHVGLLKEGFDRSSDRVATAVRETAAGLSEFDCSIDEVSAPGYTGTIDALTTIESCEFATLLSNKGHLYGCGTGYSESWRQAVSEFVSNGEYGEHLEESILINSHLLRTTEGEQYVAAQNARREFVRTIDGLFEMYDALITPTTPMTAPEFGEVASVDDLLYTEANTGPFNLTGHPAISVPGGEVDRLPVGLQVVADWNADGTAAKLASAVETLG